MKNIPVKLPRYLLVLLLPLLIFGCSAAKPSAKSDLTWKVGLSKSEVKDKLEAVVTVQQYNGSSDEFRQQLPNEGNVYLLMKLTVSKQGSGPAPFDWSKLVIKDNSGTTYNRHANDTFLEEFKYAPRMTALEIKLGENEGWVCYEMPAKAAEGKLSLVYSGDGSQQEIEVK
jgi:hypothetical protein